MVRLLFIVFIILNCVAPLASTVGAALPTNDDLSTSQRMLARAELISPQLSFGFRMSPNGSFVSFHRRDGRETSLYVRNLRAATAIRVPLSPEDTVLYQGWTRDNRLLCILRRRATSGRLVIFDPVERKITRLHRRPLTAVYSYLTRLNPSNPFRILTSNEKDGARLFRVDFKKGKLEPVERIDDALPLTSSRLPFGVAVKELSSGEEQWVAWTPTGPRVLFTATEIDQKLGTHLLAFDDAAAKAVFADSTDVDTLGLTEVDLITGVKTRISHETSDVTAVLLGSNGASVDAYQTHYTKPYWTAVNAKIEGDIGWLVSTLGAAPSIIDRDKSDRVWLVAANSDTRPEEAYLYQRDQRRLTALSSNARAWAAQRGGQPMLPFVTPSEEGLDLVSYLTLPSPAVRSRGSRIPLVVLIHGGPHERDYFGFNLWHQWLASRGYGVLSVNFRGSRGFGKKFELAGQQVWAGGIQSDLEHAIRKAQSLAPIDPERIAVFGISFGGFTAVNALTMFPTRFSCAAAISAPLDLVGLITEYERTRPSYVEDLLAQLALADRGQANARLSVLSPSARVERIVRPVLMINGDSDNIAPYESARAFVRSLSRTTSNYVFITLDGAGHADIVDGLSLGVVENFLHSCVGGRAQPITYTEKRARKYQVVGEQRLVPGLVCKSHPKEALYERRERCASCNVP